MCNCKCHQNTIPIHNSCIKINLTSYFLILSHKPLFHRLIGYRKKYNNKKETVKQKQAKQIGISERNND